MKRILNLLAAISLFFTVPPILSQQTPKADLLLFNANVITMNQKQPLAQAIAVAGGRIIWTGSNDEARRRFPNAGSTLDLGGATVLPGIIDAHTHMMNLGESLIRVDLRVHLRDIKTEQEVVERVKQRVRKAAPGEWIFGWGWDEGAWASHYPTHHALSEAAPDNPVYLMGLHSFAVWVNKKALDIAGITKDTKDPENGKIIRDEKTGEPTGILTDQAQSLVHLPSLTLPQVKNAIELAARECVRHGLTSVHEARVIPLMIRAFRELIKEGRLPLRVYVMLDGADIELLDEWFLRGPEIDTTDHRLTIRSIKLFADGALGSRGAALFEPYSDKPDTKGVIMNSEADIYNLTRRFLQRGFQVSTHAIGDAANRLALGAYERALKEVPSARDARLRIEHAQVLALEDIPRFAKLGVIASMQPTHCTSDMVWAEKRVGPQRIKGAYAWRSLLDSGARVPLSSDFPGETLNPFYGIYAAITRQDTEGRPSGGWYANQRMTLEEALRGYTIEAAYAEFEDDVKGSIEAGKLADIIVISKDITKIAPKEILSIKVLKTFVNGKLVYDAGKSN
ncbi:MAG: amidohydrolase [Blastocatellia bacterium]|nr:amidohydrolase [Blastocatellia bacterium]